MHDAIDKWVQVNDIIVDIKEPRSGVDWGFLLITVEGELSIIFLVSRFGMGGCFKGWRVLWGWWRWMMDGKPCSEVHILLL